MIRKATRVVVEGGWGTYDMGTRLEYKIQNVNKFKKKLETALTFPKNKYPKFDPNTKFRINCPAVETRQRTMRMEKRNMIWMLTILSTAVRLIGAAVAFLMSFVSWPVKTTMP